MERKQILEDAKELKHVVATRKSTNEDIVPGFEMGKDDSIRIQLQAVPEVKGCLILYLTGYVDTYNVRSFEPRVEKAIKAGFNKLILYCHSLNYASTTGIGAFISLMKAVQPSGGGIVFVEMQLKVLEVFQLLGLGRFFTFTDTIEAALECFHSSSSGQMFPKVFACPICGKRLRVGKAGRFRCAECKTILQLTPAGQVLLG